MPEIYRNDLTYIASMMYHHGLIEATSGNISIRIDADRFLVTPSGLPKWRLNDDQWLTVNAEGDLVGDNPNLAVTSEITMHLEVYRQRPDVGAVIHAHPPYAIALTMADVDMADYTIPESLVIVGQVATTPYATPSSPENRAAIASLITEHDAILLAYHGSLTVGRHIWEAYYRLQALEKAAQIISLAHGMGVKRLHLTPQQIKKLNHLHATYDMRPPSQDD